MSNTLSNQTLVGSGLYSLSEAARFTQVSANSISRWFLGYAKSGEKSYDPLWSKSFDGLSDKLVLTFRDLTEVRVAQSLLKHGISPQRVRMAIKKAKSILSDERPLSSAKFRTDGRAIFLQVAAEELPDEKVQLLDIFKNQFAFKRIVEPSLRDIDYQNYAPSRWWINGRDKGIVLDPARSFGRPIDAKSSVPTGVLANAFIGLCDFGSVAKAYDVPISAVKRAVAFERQLAA